MLRCLRLNCNWELAEDDVYCGWCGAKLKNYEVRLSRERVFLGFSSDSPEVFLEIDNTGQMPVTVTVHPPILSYLSLSWPTADAGEKPIQPLEDTGSPPLKVTLSGGKQLKVPIAVDVVSPPRAFHRGYFQISADDGQPPKGLCLTLVPQPRISINLIWPEQDQKAGKKTGMAQKRSKPSLPVGTQNEFTLSGTLRVDEGGLLLGGLDILDPVGVCRLYLRSALEDPKWLSEEETRELPFEVVVNTAELRRRYCQAGERLDHLSWEFIPEVLEPSEEIDATGLEVRELTCLWPPLLEVLSLHQWELHYAFPERRYIRSVTLRNMGGSDLTLTQVEIEDAVPWARLLLHASADLPIKIPPQMERTLQIKIITENLKYDFYETTVRVISNSCAGHKVGAPVRLSELSSPVQLREMTLPVRLTVKAPQDYQGVVAIDFGTTNSCCAIGERGSLPAIFPLETRVKENTEQDTMPSAIFYERLDNEDELEVRTFSVGSKAKDVLHLQELRDCLFYSIKRRLGERPPYYPKLKVHFRETPERLWECWPQEVAADTIRQGILQILEDQLQKRVTEVVITHPARFAYWQMEALKEAFSLCGVKVTHQISEPVAAALDYMMNRTSQDGIYHLVVFDFGGGSTDIALLEVEERQKGKKSVIRPKLMDLDGDPFFGGDDLTNLVAQHLISIAYLILRQTRGELPEFPPLSRLGEHYPNEWVSKTWAAVWQEAERFKTSGEELKTGIPVTIFTPQGQKFTEDIIIRQSVIADLARGAIEERIKYIPRMLKDRGITKPDVILLAGRSCRLPVVRELIEELLGKRYEAEIAVAGQHELPEETDKSNPSHPKKGETTEELKECVARGACRFGFLKRARSHERGVEIEPQGELEMATSSFGTGFYTRPTFMFVPVIKMGSKIGNCEEIENIEGVESEIDIWENLDRHNPEIDKNPKARLLATFNLAPEMMAKLHNVQPERCRTMMRLNNKHELEIRLEVYPEKAGEGNCESFDYTAVYRMSGE